jgi:hypothetical protein
LKLSTQAKLEMIQTLLMSRPQVLLAKPAKLTLALSVVASQLVVEAANGRTVNV